MISLTSALWATNNSLVETMAETQLFVRPTMVGELTRADAPVGKCEASSGRDRANFDDAALDRLVTCLGRANLSTGTAEDHQ